MIWGERIRKVHLADGCFNFSGEKKCIYEIIIILVNYISMLSHLHTREVGQAPLKEKSYSCIIQICVGNGLRGTVRGTYCMQENI